MDDEIRVKIFGPLGVKKPYRQGGCFALTLPKRMVKNYEIEQKEEEFFQFVFLDTDKGILLVPLDKSFTPDNVKNALKFFDISDLTQKDLENLFSEEE